MLLSGSGSDDELVGSTVMGEAELEVGATTETVITVLAVLYAEETVVLPSINVVMVE